VPGRSENSAGAFPEVVKARSALWYQFDYQEGFGRDPSLSWQGLPLAHPTLRVLREIERFPVQWTVAGIPNVHGVLSE